MCVCVGGKYPASPLSAENHWANYKAIHIPDTLCLQLSGNWAALGEIDSYLATLATR